VRVGIIAFMHESNTFIQSPTTLAHFEQDLLVEGEDVRDELADAHHEIGGFFQGLKAENVEAAPIFAARALPHGTVQADAFDDLFGRIESSLDQAPQLDGLLVAPHGAMVSERYPDADGEWLSRLRQRFGSRFPIVGTLDLHANLSPLMVQSCDALIAYLTNPHLDQRQRGIEAATLMARTLRGEVRPTMAAAFPPLAVNIERQLTAAPPCKPLYDQANAMRGQPGVLSNSLLLGFPYADVAEMGSAVIVVTDNDPAGAQGLANGLARTWWTARQDFVGQMVSVAQALAQAADLEGPICLLDMGDNVGGGSPGDGTTLAHALDRPGLGPAFICLNDAEAVRLAEAAGIGAPVRLRVGGKADRLHGEPLETDFRVVGLFDGRFEETVPRHGGITRFDQGRTAVVGTVNGLVVMLTSRPWCRSVSRN
jgi:microcystin degradation protein MlrC